MLLLQLHFLTLAALCADVLVHTSPEIAERRGYLCYSGISEQQTQEVVTLIDYGDIHDATHCLLCHVGCNVHLLFIHRDE